MKRSRLILAGFCPLLLALACLEPDGVQPLQAQYWDYPLTVKWSATMGGTRHWSALSSRGRGDRCSAAVWAGHHVWLLSVRSFQLSWDGETSVSTTCFWVEPSCKAFLHLPLGSTILWKAILFLSGLEILKFEINSWTSASLEKQWLIRLMWSWGGLLAPWNKMSLWLWRFHERSDTGQCVLSSANHSSVFFSKIIMVWLVWYTIILYIYYYP